MKKRSIKRRKFIGTAGGAAAGLSLGFSPKIFISPASSTRANNSIICGLIGVGSQGSRLIRAMGEISDIAMVALCDIYPPHLEAGRKLVETTFGNIPEGYDDYRRLLDRNDLDAIFICTPNIYHRQMYLDSLDRDLHIFAEKPLCHTIEECIEVYRAVKRRGEKKVFQVGQHRRSLPHYIKAMEMINEGKIGKVRQIRATWHWNNSQRRRLPEDSQYSQKYLDELLNWRLYRKTAGGPGVDQGTHQVDIANWVMDEPPLNVMGRGCIDWDDGRDVYDNVNLVFQYINGIQYHYSLLYNNAHMGVQEMILGSEGTIQLEMRGAAYWQEEKQRQERLPTTSLQTMQIITGATRRAGRLSPHHEMGELIGDIIDDYYKVEMEEFFQNIRENRKPRCDVEIGRNAAVAMYMGIQAIETGSIVYWNREWDKI